MASDAQARRRETDSRRVFIIDSWPYLILYKSMPCAIRNLRIQGQARSIEAAPPRRAAISPQRALSSGRYHSASGHSPICRMLVIATAKCAGRTPSSSPSRALGDIQDGQLTELVRAKAPWRPTAGRCRRREIGNGNETARASSPERPAGLAGCEVGGYAGMRCRCGQVEHDRSFRLGGIRQASIARPASVDAPTRPVIELEPHSPRHLLQIKLPQSI